MDTKKIRSKGKTQWTKLVGLTRKGNDLTKKQIAKARIQKKKEKFGVAYMDLVEKGATQQQLQDTFRTYEAEIQKIREEIKAYDEKISLVDEKIERKLNFTEPEIRMTGTIEAF